VDAALGPAAEYLVPPRTLTLVPLVLRAQWVFMWWIFFHISPLLYHKINLQSRICEVFTWSGKVDEDVLLLAFVFLSVCL
jgi:hypothetical protein